MPAGLVRAALARAGAGNPLLTFAEAGGPVADLIDAGDFAANAGNLIDAVGRWLGAHERRVAASLVVLGYSARLVGPTVAVLLRDGLLVDARPGRLRFGFAAGHGFRLVLPEPSGWVGDPAALAARWRTDTLGGHLAMVVAAVRADTPVPAGLLWGNVASGLLGALATLAASAAVSPGRCADFATAALTGGPLAGTGDVRLVDGVPRFHRRSCCLYYRLPSGGYCGDCCFTRTPEG